MVSSASALFADAGFEETSTGAIAAAAGVSEGIIYHYFGTKHGVLEACVVEQARAVVGRAMAPPMVDFDVMLAEVFTWVRTDAMTGRLAAGGDERVMGVLRRGWQRSVVPALTRALRGEQEAGRCRNVDPGILARLQFAVVGEAMVMHFSPDPTSVASFDAIVAETAHTLRSMMS